MRVRSPSSLVLATLIDKFSLSSRPLVLSNSKELFCLFSVPPSISSFLLPISSVSGPSYLGSPKVAMIQILSLRWGAPTPAAGILNAWTSYPSSSKLVHTVSKTMPSWMLTIPRTFSPTTILGLSALIMRNISGQRCRSSLVPFCLPATENG